MGLQRVLVSWCSFHFYPSILACVHLPIHLFNSPIVIAYFVAVASLGLVTINTSGTDPCKMNHKDSISAV